MATDFDKYVGGRIKHFRNLRGFSQGSLGREIGISPQQVQKYEQGISRISIQMAYRFKLVLGFELNDLIPDGNLKSIGDLAAELRNEKYTRLVKYFKTLSIRNQDIVSRLVKDLTGSDESSSHNDS